MNIHNHPKKEDWLYKEGWDGKQALLIIINYVMVENLYLLKYRHL